MGSVKKPYIVCIGDLHVGKLSHMIPSFTERQIKTLRAVLAKEIALGATDCILLGDVFNVPEPSQALIVAVLSVVAEFDLTFHVIAGNHDYLSVDTHAFTLFDFLAKSSKGRLRVYLKPTLVKINGFTYFMCPHPFHDPVPSRAVLGFGHFPWTGAKRDTLSVETHGETPKGEWILGDFHGHQTGPRFTYAGSFTKLGFQESEQTKGYLRLRGAKYEFVPTPKKFLHYDMVQVAINKDTHFKNIPDDPNVFVRVTFVSGYQPPPGWQAKHPNVVRHVFVGKRSVTKSVLADTVFHFDASLRDTLKLHLEKKEKLSPAATKRVMKLASKYLPKGSSHA
jgi:DNA repair exonuclease SbcCD nuclease subunit